LVHPSGAQWEIRHGDQVAVVVEVGGGLRLYEVRGVPVLDGYGVGEMCAGGRGQNLIPWPNRLAGGRYEFNGRSLQLPINEVAKQNAIHGLVRWANWTLSGLEPSRVRVAYVLHPQPGYPFMLGLEIEYALDGSGLQVSVSATNLGLEPLPYAAGHHPYLTVGEPTIDSARIQLRATSSRDYREPRVVGEARLDTPFTGLERDDRGLAWFEMQAGHSDRVVRIWMDSTYTHVMLFSGDTLQDESRRRGGLAVEPMTCAPNAFATGDGLITLAPAASHQSTWGIVPG
jgi:aldose 1-epimerase